MDFDEETTTETTTESSSSDERAPILAVDMDETIIQSDTEELVPGAKDALLKLRELGWKIIIWTCRGDVSRDSHTREILDRHGIPYDAINENLPGIKDKSRKIVFDAIVDNKNVDFNDGWEAIVGEVEHRRKGWQDQGITKARILQIDPITGEESLLQEWGLAEDGTAVLLKGDLDAYEWDFDSDPSDGVEFLKNVDTHSVSNTYIFAEVARGNNFMFAPKKLMKVPALDGSDDDFDAIFEGLIGQVQQKHP